MALAKGKTVIVPTREKDGFRLTADQLKSAISPATKALILNNPSNPTGAAYERRHLEALAEVIKGEDIYVIADEIYDKLVYDGFLFTSFAALGEDIKKKTIIINGVSKAYSMTGWRIGFAAGPADVINGMSKIQSHTTSSACSISQKAGLEAFCGPQDEVQRMVSVYLVKFSWMALIPAALMFSGVGKSGSPTLRSMTSIPSDRMDLTLAKILSVGDAPIWLTFSEIMFRLRHGFFLLGGHVGALVGGID